MFQDTGQIIFYDFLGVYRHGTFLVVLTSVANYDQCRRQSGTTGAHARGANLSQYSSQCSPFFSIFSINSWSACSSRKRRNNGMLQHIFTSFSGSTHRWECEIVLIPEAYQSVSQSLFVFSIIRNRKNTTCDFLGMK